MTFFGLKFFSGKLITDRAKKAENPHQNPAALYSAGQGDPLGMGKFKLILGSNDSHINWTDLDDAMQILTHIAAGFTKNFGYVPHIAVGVKHGTPCGAGIDDDSSARAMEKMVEGNPEALFGGLVLVNFEMDEKAAHALSFHAMPEKVGKDGGKKKVQRRLDVIAAPAISNEAQTLLGRKEGKCKMLVNPALQGDGAAQFDTAPRLRKIRDAYVTQGNYTYILDKNDPALWKSAEVSDKEWKDIVLARHLSETSRGNVISIVRDGRLIASGSGQVSRFLAAKVAVMITGEVRRTLKQVGVAVADDLKGAVASSNGFFAFPDAPQVLIDAGVKTILSVSGSINDAELNGSIVKQGVKLIIIPERGFYGH